jgi:pyruvate dehydrogenase E2 component (dihydrolipoamide acetyltransferase)
MAEPQTTTAKGDVTFIEPTRPQQLVGRRAAEAKATIPDFAVGAELDLEALATWRSATVAPPSPTALLVRAVALALRDHPRLNAAYRDNRFEQYGQVNVGVTLPVGDTVATPTLFAADAEPAAALDAKLTALSDGARAGTLTAPQLGNATFTVHDLGASGARTLTPILAPGQAGALGAGAIAPRAGVHEGALAVRHTCAVTLVADQRIVGVHDAAAFLARLGALLADPMAL